MHIPQYDRARKCYLFCIRFFMPPDDRQEKHGSIYINNSDYLQKAQKYGHFTGYKN